MGPDGRTAGSTAELLRIPEPPPQSRRGWWQLLKRREVRWALEIAVVAIVVEWFLLPQFSGSRDRIGHLLSLNSPWLVLVVAAELLSLTAFAAATRAMLPPAVRPRLTRLLRIDLSTIALSHSVPGGSAAGTGLGLRLLSEAGVPVGNATFAKIAQGLTSGVVLQLLLITGLVAVIPTRPASALYVGLACTGVLLVVLVSAAVIGVRRGRDWLAALVGRFTGWLPFVDDTLGHRFVHSIAESVESVMSDRRRLAQALLWSAANWLLDALALWASVRLYGHTLGYLSLIVPFGIASTLAWIPLTPGGLGFVEATMVPVLVSFGVPKAGALLGVITWRLVAFWFPIPLGATAYATLRAARTDPAPVPG